MASTAERQIRDALVDWFHTKEPTGRVIHELPLDGFSAAGRADMAVVFKDHIVLIEIKSEKDKLTRLEKQFHAMAVRSHDFIIVCHDKWFADDGSLINQEWARYSHLEHFWRYPEPGAGWNFNRYKPVDPPNPLLLLSMLWASELRACYDRCRVAGVGMSAPMQVMQRDLVAKLTGRQVTRAVCAALRWRDFAEADRPILDEVH